ncbi:HNH endonuclease family protein [Mycobacteroides chelonae]|uniref:HNH endonuclease family protein n=1 Tax=Mycobacteroides chelonae TaxID=1774 RepID=UPI001F426D0B|nr:HNH endonuclease family protein [Mycobacteroides chelonae]
MACAIGLAVAGAATQHQRQVATSCQPSPNHTSSAENNLDELLTKVVVVPQLNKVPGYERGCRSGQSCVFGPAWQDPSDHSGCDTRNRLLAASFNDVEFKPRTRNCKVSSGWRLDPYTCQRITPQDSQIDHIVPLHRGWNAGAWRWDLIRRQLFANDMANLIAVSAKANESKGDSGLESWLPANTAERCVYATQYLKVSIKYQLPITVGDRAAAAAACLKGTPS